MQGVHGGSVLRINLCIEDGTDNHTTMPLIPVRYVTSKGVTEVHGTFYLKTFRLFR